MEELWTIAELSERVSSALAGTPAPANGQVRAVPNQRTIRYYTTLGLLRGPLEMRGRTALYGPQHLRQLVAIKRLQLEGLTLSQIQSRLAGADPVEVSELAKLPPTSVSATPSPRSFWLDEPSPPTPAAPPPDAPLAAPTTAPPPAAPPRRRRRPTPAAEPTPKSPTPASTPTSDLAGFTLAPGITLLVDTNQHDHPTNLADLRHAAAPLLAALGLASPDQPT